MKLLLILLIPILLFSQSRKLWVDSLFVKDTTGTYIDALTATIAGQSVNIREHLQNNNVINVKDFGAVGDGVTDDTQAIRSAIAEAATGGTVILPKGTFLVSNLDIPIRLNFIGNGWGTVISGAPGSDYVVKFTSQDLDSSNHDNRQMIGDFNIGGTAICGIIFDSSAVNLAAENIHFKWGSGPFTYGFEFVQGWGSRYTNFSTHGADIDTACFYIHGGGFNANLCETWYTSNDATYSLLFRGGTTYVNHGNSFNNMTFQTSYYGIKINGSVLGTTFTGLYTEECVKPVYLGDGSTIVRDIVFNGGTLGTLSSGHYYYGDRIACVELVNVRGGVFNGIYFNGVNATPIMYAIRLGTAIGIVLNGCILPSAAASQNIQDYIVKSSTASAGSGVMAVNCGKGPEYESQLVMQTDDWANHHQVITVHRNTNISVKDGNKIGAIQLSSGSASVTFGTPEEDANYYVFLSTTTNETVYFSTKLSTGFTINSSNSSSSAWVWWMIVRDGPEWAFEEWIPATADTAYTP